MMKARATSLECYILQFASAIMGILVLLTLALQHMVLTFRVHLSRVSIRVPFEQGWKLPMLQCIKRFSSATHVASRQVPRITFVWISQSKLYNFWLL
jgi:hypothetical protein